MGSISSTEELIRLLPLRPLPAFKPLLFNQLMDIEFPDPSMQIHIIGSNERGAMVQLIRDIEAQRHRQRQINTEEPGYQFPCRLILIPDRGKRNPELCNEDENVEEKPDPGTDDTGLGGEG